MKTLLIVIALLLPVNLYSHELLVHETPDNAFYLDLDNSIVTTSSATLNMFSYKKDSDLVLNLQIKVDSIGDSLRVSVLHVIVFDSMGNIKGHEKHALFFMLKPDSLDPLNIAIIRSLEILIGELNV